MIKTQTKDEVSWLCQVTATILAPTEVLLISQWAEKNIRLPDNTAEPGPYSLDRTPYMKEPLDCLSPSVSTNEIVLLTGSQVSKTTALEMASMYYIAASPRPQMFVQPTEKESAKFVSTKLDPLIKANKVVSSKLTSPNKKSSGDTIARKDYLGGFLVMAYAESAKTLASTSVGYAAMDEIDRNKVTSEGDPIELLRNRMITFGARYKLALSSTPTNSKSAIIREFEDTDKRYYYVPCPHCKELFILKWEYMEWDAEGTHVKRAWMHCPHCDEKIIDADKQWMLQNQNGAKWIPTNQEATNPTKRGYHLSGLYSPVGWLSWEQCVERYLKAKKDPERMTAFYNTVLALPYEVALDIPPWKTIKERADASEYHRGVVPEGVLFITTGSDVQKNRIETVIKGWGRGGRSWVIDHRIFLVPAGWEITQNDCPVWKEYEENILKGVWFFEGGACLGSILNCLDRSYETRTIDYFYVTHREFNLFPIRGVDNKTNLLPQFKEGNDKEAVKGIRPVYYDTAVSQYKLKIYEQLKKEDNEQQSEPFVNFFPNDMGEEFYQQLTAEQYIPAKRSGKMGEWKKVRARNEVLDCVVYNMAAWYLLGGDNITSEEYDVLEETIRDMKTHANRGSQVRRQTAKRKVRSRGIL